MCRRNVWFLSKSGVTYANVCQNDAINYKQAHRRAFEVTNMHLILSISNAFSTLFVSVTTCYNYSRGSSLFNLHYKGKHLLFHYITVSIILSRYTHGFSFPCIYFHPHSPTHARISVLIYTMCTLQIMRKPWSFVHCELGRRSQSGTTNVCHKNIM